MKKIDFSKIRRNLKNKEVPKKEIIQAVKQIKPKIENLKLKVNLGTEDVIITSYLVAIVSAAIGIILPHVTYKNTTKCDYIIKPIYKDKNEYAVALNGIFSIKIVHIIYSMFILLKKGRDKNNERASNRRSYAYDYE